MVDFMMDKPRRRGLAAAVKEEAGTEIYLISSAEFFSFRSKDMTPTGEFSQAIVDQLLAKYPLATFVVYCTPSCAPIRAALDALQNPCIRTFESDPQNVGDTAVKLKSFLTSLGVRFKPIRNPRTVSVLNISRFVVGGTLQCITRDDYDKLGIEPDKELTFADMAKQRRKNAWL